MEIDLLMASFISCKQKPRLALARGRRATIGRQVGQLMPNDRVSVDGAFLEALRRSRDALHQQIRQSQLIIERSNELLKYIDEMVSESERARVA
jgi:hypothetical protein